MSKSPELTIEQLFKKCNDIVINDDGKKFAAAIDYSIEILKLAPDSMIGYYVSICVSIMCGDSQNMQLRKKFRELYDEYFAASRNIDSDTIEKIILAEFFLSGYSIDKAKGQAIDPAWRNGKNLLMKIKDKCRNKDHSALAALFLITRLPYGEVVEVCDEFKKTYPSHRAMPLVEIILALKKYYFNAATRDYDKVIDENKRIIERYNEIDSPFGDYKLVMECYAYIVRAHVKKGDIFNARKYFDIIKSEAPGYYDLKGLKSEINDFVRTDEKRD